MEQRHLAEAFPWTELRQLVLDAVLPTNHLTSALDDDVQTIAQIVFVEHGLTRLIVLLHDAPPVLDLELHRVWRHDHVHEPRQGGPRPAVPAWQLHEVDASPQRPCQHAAELHAEDFRHGRPMAEGAHLAQFPEVELLRLPPANGAHDVVCRHRRFAHRMLGRRRTEAVPAGIGDEGTIADSPDVIAAHHLHAQVHRDAATLLRQLQAVDDGVRAAGHGGHHGLGRDPGTIAQDDFVARRGRDAGSEAHVHASSRQLPMGQPPQVVNEFGQDVVGHLEENHADVAALDAAVRSGHATDEVVELRCAFHAAEAASHDDEGEQGAFQRGIRLNRRLLQRVDRVVAEVERIAEVLEGQCMLAEARDSAQIGDIAEREDQVVIGDVVGHWLEAGAGRDHTVLEIHGFHRPHMDAGVPQQPPEGTHRIEDPDAAGDDLRQHRLVHEVVVAVDQRDVEVVLPAAQLLESPGGVDAGETAAQDQDSGTTGVWSGSCGHSRGSEGLCSPRLGRGFLVMAPLIHAAAAPASRK